MDFWSAYGKEAKTADFGTRQLWLNTGDRPNASIARLLDRSIDLAPGSAVFQHWSLGKRYLIAKNVVFDLFLSFYDVNSKAVMAMRITRPMERDEVNKARKSVHSLKNSNIEIRAIGLQNGDKTLLKSVEDADKIADGDLVEVDLFGNQTRHLIIDLLTGKPYSLLLENRIYRPGELISAAKKEDFDKTKSELNFL